MLDTGCSILDYSQHRAHGVQSTVEDKGITAYGIGREENWLNLLSQICNQIIPDSQFISLSSILTLCPANPQSDFRNRIIPSPTFVPSHLLTFSSPLPHSNFRIHISTLWSPDTRNHHLLISTFRTNSRASCRVLPLNLIAKAASSISGLMIRPSLANTARDARAQSIFLIFWDFRSI